MRKSLPSFVMGAVGAAFLTAAIVASASRNAAGTMSLYTPGNPVVSGTSISTSWANNTLSDLSTELTDSLSRSGKGGMLAALREIDGTVATPAYSFTNDTGSGLYRIGSSDFGFALAGVKVAEWTVNGYRSANGAVATPSLSFFNDTGSGFYRIGSNDIGFAINGVLVHEWTASANTILQPLTQTLSGSATTVSASFLEASLANGNSTQFFLGKAQSNNNSLGLSYTPNATAALSTACFGVYGQNSVCSNGNNLTTTGSLQIGASGTSTAQMNFGTGTFNAGTPATFTATVASGAKCLATHTVQTNAVSVSVTATTLTVQSAVNGDAGTANWVCF